MKGKFGQCDMMVDQQFFLSPSASHNNFSSFSVKPLGYSDLLFLQEREKEKRNERNSSKPKGNLRRLGETLVVVVVVLFGFFSY